MTWMAIASIVLSILAVAVSIWFFLDMRKMFRKIDSILDEWEQEDVRSNNR